MKAEKVFTDDSTCFDIQDRLLSSNLLNMILTQVRRLFKDFSFLLKVQEMVKTNLSLPEKVDQDLWIV